MAKKRGRMSRNLLKWIREYYGFQDAEDLEEYVRLSELVLAARTIDEGEQYRTERRSPEYVV